MTNQIIEAVSAEVHVDGTPVTREMIDAHCQIALCKIIRDVSLWELLRFIVGIRWGGWLDKAGVKD